MSTSERRSAAIEYVVRRPLLQPCLFVGLALIYIWVIRPTRFDPVRIPFLALIIVIPFISNLLHRDTLPALGLRLDNIGRSAVGVGVATLVGAAAVLTVGLAVGSGLDLGARTVRSFLLYPGWGLVQQYAMQSFTYRRLREAIPRPAVAAALAAVMFASLHWPNYPLTLMTLLGGYVWCRLFERHPNLITLALSHGWLAVLLRYSWPAEWLHNLRIGPGYWTWTP